jgi:hypothetical protein
MVSRFFLLVVFFAGSASWLDAQTTGYVASPSNFPLFRPSTDLGEGIYTNLPFQLSLYTAIGYDDNVFAQHSDRTGSGFTQVSLNLASHISNERTRLDADLGLGVDAYWSRPGRSIDPNVNLNLSFSHQINPRTTLTLTSYFSWTSQPNLQLGVGSANQVSDYFYTSNQISLGYQWTPRFSTVTSYTGNLLVYDNSDVGDSLNRLENTFGQQLRFLVLPTITAVAEYRFGYVDYFSNDHLNSFSNFALGGAEISLSRRLTFGFRAGGEFRHYEEAQAGQQQDLAYPYAESTLTYLYRPDSYVEWYNRYGLEESDLGGGYRRTFRTGLKVNHLFGKRLRLIGAIYYSYNDYANPSFTENVLDLNLGVTYQFTRALALSAGYTFERDFSDILSRDYYRNRAYSGLLFAF